VAAESFATAARISPETAARRLSGTAATFT
jgi:hypothetical protein